jgi:hypothetical protein
MRNARCPTNVPSKSHAKIKLIAGIGKLTPDKGALLTFGFL